MFTGLLCDQDNKSIPVYCAIRIIKENKFCKYQKLAYFLNLFIDYSVMIKTDSTCYKYHGLGHFVKMFILV